MRYSIIITLALSAITLTLVVGCEEPMSGEQVAPYTDVFVAGKDIDNDFRDDGVVDNVIYNQQRYPGEIFMRDVLRDPFAWQQGMDFLCLQQGGQIQFNDWGYWGDGSQADTYFVATLNTRLDRGPTLCGFVDDWGNEEIDTSTSDPLVWSSRHICFNIETYDDGYPVIYPEDNSGACTGLVPQFGVAVEELYADDDES